MFVHLANADNETRRSQFMNKKLIIFDFDGTIVDTQKTIIVSKQETLRQMGLNVASEQACADTIGMSAKKGFQKLCPKLSDDMIDLCMKKYREIFNEIKKQFRRSYFLI